MQNNTMLSEEQITEMFDNFYVLANKIGKYFSREDFNIVSTRYLIESMERKTGFYSSVIRDMMQYHIFKRVFGKLYCPKTEVGGLVLYDRCFYGNTFRGFREFPAEDKGWTEEGVAPVKNHIYKICDGDAEKIKWVTKWIAHNIQFKGEKIFWSLVLVGGEGLEKSIFGLLLRKLLGYSNVSVIPVSELIGKYGVHYRESVCSNCVSIVEGIGKTGLSKITVRHGLKCATERKKLTIESGSLFNIRKPNITNYIILLNSLKDSPFDENHRVFYFVHTPPDIAKDIRSSDYMPELWDCIENKTSEIYHWLMSIDVDKPNFTRDAPDFI